jgi:hypothetical protein
MTIRISLPADIEAKLRERAAAEGKDPAALALEAVQEKLGGGNAVSGRPSAAERIAAWERFVAGMCGWTQTLLFGHRVDDTREAIYQGRGE